MRRTRCDRKIEDRSLATVCISRALPRAEVEKALPRLAKKFDLIDADRDGRLTEDELRAYREAKRGRVALR